MAPSHRITFTSADGTPAHVIEVRMARHLNSPTVYHDADPHALADSWCWERPYYPHDPTSGWHCCGQPTPGCRAGEVVVEPLKPIWGLSAARWRFSIPNGDPKQAHVTRLAI
jgi:hypothetical protein